MGAFWKRVAAYFRINQAILLIPVCGFAIYDSVFQSFSSILGVLKDAYPDIPIAVIQMVVTVPPLVSIPGTLLSGVLASYIRKKRIAEFALLVIFVGGMIPVVFQTPTIGALFLCSGLIGLGQGLLHPMANAIICQQWAANDEERGRALGFKQAFNYIGEVAFTMAIGILALSHWGNAFLVYLGVIPLFFITVVYLPQGEPDQKLADKKHGVEGLKEAFSPQAIYLYIIFFCGSLFMYGYYTNIALLVQDRDFGTTADVAAISSVLSIVSLILGVGFGVVTSLFRRFTLTVAFAALAVGMFVVAMSVNLPMVYAGVVLLGFGIGIQQISTIFYLSKVVSPKSITIAISIMLSFVAAGASVAPVVINGLEAVFFGVQSAVAGLAVAGAGYAVLTLVDGVRSLTRSHGIVHPDQTAKSVDDDLRKLEEME